MSGPGISAPAEWQTFGEENDCPCCGAYDGGVAGGTTPGSHYVWIAFLHYENNEFRREQWIRDYYLLPTNWLTCKLSGSDLYHCQMFFWNQVEGTFVTFSVDAHRQQVHYSTQKTFEHGWSFLRLTVTQRQERDMYEFLAAQAMEQRPFNWLGAWLLFFRPIPTGHSTWFCSQLVVAALQSAGLLRSARPEATSPAALFDVLKNSSEITVLESPHPIRTRTIWKRVDEPVTATGLRFDL